MTKIERKLPLKEKTAYQLIFGETNKVGNEKFDLIFSEFLIIQEEKDKKRADKKSNHSNELSP